MSVLQKKKDQLGIDPSTAAYRLRKALHFDLLVKAELNFCFQCGEEIQTEKELSIEHKKPWLDSPNPLELFFDLDNVSYSHLSCNIKARRVTIKKYFTDEQKAQASRDHTKNYDRKQVNKDKRKARRKKRFLETGIW